MGWTAICLLQGRPFDKPRQRDTLPDIH